MTGKVSILVCPLAPHTTNIKVLSFALYGGGEEGNIVPQPSLLVMNQWKNIEAF